MTLAGVLIAESLRSGAVQADETFVVFADRIFRYRRGDPAGRAAAERHGRSVGVPEAQLDWPEA